MKGITLNRRTMMKGLLAIVALPSAMVSIGSLKAAADEVVGEDKLLKADDPVGKALKYNSDGTKAPERKDARMGVAAKDQKCGNCALYAKSGKLKDGTEVGKCTMLQSGLVKSQGWCMSWSKKA